MKKLLVLAVLILTIALVGCDNFKQGNEVTAVDNMDVCYVNDSIWDSVSDITCFIGEIDVQYSYLEYIQALERKITE